ncbi:MAG: hypothetical protein R3F49_20430 [Planctomycetota bacterium]
MNTTRFALAFALVSGAAQAQTFNVDFGSGASVFGTPASTYGAASGQSGVWNALDSDAFGVFYASSPLTTTTGAVSSVVLEIDALGSGGFFSLGVDEVNTTGDDQALMDDCYYNGGPSTLTVRGLAPGNYRFFTYAMAPDNSSFFTGVEVVGSIDPLQSVGGDFSAGFAPGVTHAEHSVTVTTGAAVVINFTVSSQFDSINGLQITQLGPPGLGSNFCTANANSTGSAAAMSAMGSASVAANNVVLMSSGMPQNAFGFFLTSMTQGNTPNPGGSQGLLCLSGSIGRYVGAGQIKNSGTLGEFELAIDLMQHPSPSGFVTVMPGQTWHFTSWYRDVVGGSATSNFADGLSVTFN